MLFDKHKNKDLQRQEIKQAVEGSEEERKKAQKPSGPARKSSASAPLFIKVDRYKELLTSVQQMRTFVRGMKHTFSVLSDLEDVRKQAIQTLNITLQRLEKTVVSVDNQLLKPDVDLGKIKKGGKEVKQIESSLTELEDQLSSLRNELEGLR